MPQRRIPKSNAPYLAISNKLPGSKPGCFLTHQIASLPHEAQFLGLGDIMRKIWVAAVALSSVLSVSSGAEDWAGTSATGYSSGSQNTPVSVLTGNEAIEANCAIYTPFTLQFLCGSQTDAGVRFVPISEFARSATVNQVSLQVGVLAGTQASFSDAIGLLQGDVTTLGTTLNSRMALVEGDISTLQSDVSGLASGMASVTGSVGTLQAQVSTLSTSVDSRVSSVENNMVSLQGQVGALSTNVSGVSQSVANAQAAVTTLNNRVGAIETAVGSLATSESVNALSTRVSTSEGQITSLAASVAGVSQSVQTVQAEVNILGTALNGRVGLLETSVAALATTASVNALSERVNSSEGQLASMQQDLTALATFIPEAMQEMQQEARAGAAMAASLETVAPAPGSKNRLGFNSANYNGETAFSVSYVRQEGQIDVSAGVAISGDEAMVKGGVGLSW